MISFEQAICKYIEFLQLQDYAVKTTSKRKYFLSVFQKWCNKYTITDLSEITQSKIEKYHTYVLNLKKANDQLQSFDSQRRYLSCVHDFLSFLVEKNYLLINPCQRVNLPIVPTSLPRDILSQFEMKRLLQNRKLDSRQAIRDRGILELLYATGIRRQELIDLDLSDFDAEKRRLLVRLGKGKKDRLLPVTKRAAKYLNKYLQQKDLEICDALFVSNVGNRISPMVITLAIKKALKATKIKKKVSCHSFRHSLATHLLDNGCDIRHIQELLGHSSLFATQKYTRVSIVRLKEVHKKTHPLGK